MAGDNKPTCLEKGGGPVASLRLWRNVGCRAAIQ